MITPIEDIFKYEDASNVSISIPLYKYQKMVESIKFYESIYPKEIPDVAVVIMETAIDQMIEALKRTNTTDGKRMCELMIDLRRTLPKEQWKQSFRRTC